MNVIELKPDPAGRQQTVDLLSRMLYRAQNGELIGCAVVGVLENGDLTWNYTSHIDKHKLIGAIETLKLDIAGALK
jgi:hypothetical protein